jgi:hypothetical protein
MNHAFSLFWTFQRHDGGGDRQQLVIRSNEVSAWLIGCFFMSPSLYYTYLIVLMCRYSFPHSLLSFRLSQIKECTCRHTRITLVTLVKFKGTVPHDIGLYFRFWRIKLVFSAGLLMVITFFTCSSWDIQKLIFTLYGDLTKSCFRIYVLTLRTLL